MSEKKDRQSNGFIVGVFVGAFFFGFFSFFIAHAFNGPTSGPGVGNGAVGVGSTTNDISVGTSSPTSNVKLLVVGSTTDTTAYALQLLQSNAGPLLYVRNDGALSIATTTVTSGTVTIQGNLTVSGQINGGSESTAVPASNITGGVFSSNETQSNFSFPESLGVNTSSQVGLPQALSVYGNEYVSGNLYDGDAYSSGSVAYFGIDAGTGGSSGDTSTAFGVLALNGMTTGSGDDSAFGAAALRYLTTGFDDIGIGVSAGAGILGGDANLAIGDESLHAIGAGSYNVAVGEQALGLSNGSSSIAIGYNTLSNNINGNNNTAIGYLAGLNNVTGTGNVFIGYEAGMNETSSNKLYITNSTSSPLIYGDFANGWVGINTNNPSQALTVGGNIYATGNITCGGTCGGGGGVSGGQTSFIPLWTGPSSLSTSTLQETANALVTTGGFAVGTTTDQAAGNLVATGNITGGTLAILGLKSAGTPCVSVNAAGAFATTTCGGGGVSGGQNNYIPLWTGGSTLTTSSLQANGTTIYTLNGLAIGTSSTQSAGNLFITGNYLGGNLSASQVTSNAFASGNFAFSSDLNIGTSSTAGVSTLAVYGNELVTGIASDTTVNAGNVAVAATATTENGLLSVGGSLFSTTNFKNLTNSAASGTLVGTVNGTTTIPANVLKAGSQIHLSAYGLWTTQSSQQNNSFFIKLGSNSLQSLTGASIASIANKPWELTCDISIWSAGVSGVWDPSCFLTAIATGDTATPNTLALVGTTSTVNTTLANLLDLQWLWAAASTTNSITSTAVSAYLIP